MRYLFFFLFFFFIHSYAAEKAYISIEDLHLCERGIWFQYKGEYRFTQNLQFDDKGPYLEIQDESFLGMWWCTYCRKWISDRCEICPICGENK